MINNNFKNNKNGKFNKNNKKVFKPKFTKIKVNIADSEYYVSNLDSLYNLLCSIPFNKVSIPVYMPKAEMFGNDQLKGTAVFGIIDKFNNDNTFTVSVQENIAGKFNADKHGMSIRCKKDYETNEITYISSFAIIKGHSVQENYDDVEKAMLDASEETNCEPSEVSEEVTTETTEPVE